MGAIHKYLDQEFKFTGTCKAIYSYKKEYRFHDVVNHEKTVTISAEKYVLDFSKIYAMKDDFKDDDFKGKTAGRVIEFVSKDAIENIPLSKKYENDDWKDSKVILFLFTPTFHGTYFEKIHRAFDNLTDQCQKKYPTKELF